MNKNYNVIDRTLSFDLPEDVTECVEELNEEYRQMMTLHPTLKSHDVLILLAFHFALQKRGELRGSELIPFRVHLFDMILQLSVPRESIAIVSDCADEVHDGYLSLIAYAPDESFDVLMRYLLLNYVIDNRRLQKRYETEN